MRKEIPVPAVIAIIVVVLLVIGIVFWRRSGPGAQAEKTEAMIRKAFGVSRPGPSMPPSPGGMPRSSAPAPPNPGAGPGGGTAPGR